MKNLPTREPTIKMYLVKYALSSGIRLVNTRESPSPGRRYVSADGTSYKVGRDLVFTAEEARSRFLELRSAKIASLQKQIDCMRGITDREMSNLSVLSGSMSKEES